MISGKDNVKPASKKSGAGRVTEIEVGGGIVRNVETEKLSGRNVAAAVTCHGRGWEMVPR